MSKRLALTEVPGVGPALEEKLRAAGIKTANALSKADPVKLATKVDGLGEKGAQKLVSAALELVGESIPKESPKPKTVPAEEKKPKKETKPPKEKEKPKEPPKKPAKKPTEVEKPKKKEAPKPKAKKKEVKPKAKEEAPAVSGPSVDSRLLRIAEAKKRRKPKFRHEQAHRWIRVPDRWRKVRGIDSATREKRRGRIAMVSAGYRSPRAVRGLHPSGYVEALVYNAAELDNLDPKIHAVRIASTVGLRKRQTILDKAESKLFRILNPGVAEGVVEEELFEELEGLDDLEVE